MDRHAVERHCRTPLSSELPSLSSELRSGKAVFDSRGYFAGLLSALYDGADISGLVHGWVRVL